MKLIRFLTDKVLLDTTKQNTKLVFDKVEEFKVDYYNCNDKVVFALVDNNLDIIYWEYPSELIKYGRNINYT